MTQGQEASFWETFPDDKKGLRTFTRQNNLTNYQKLKGYARKGYTLNGYAGRGKYQFTKIASLDFGYERFGNIQYRLTPPKKEIDFFNKKLVVIFNSLGLSAVKASTRMFSDGAEFHIGESVFARNTYILRLADSNMTVGSMYLNTPNYPTFIEETDLLIKKVMRDLALSIDDVVLIGSSRGGFGAILHAFVGGYRAVVTDPIVSLVYDYNLDDRFFLRDDIEPDLINYIKPYFKATDSNRKITIVTNSEVPITYPYLTRLPNDRLDIIDLDAKLFSEMKHGELIAGSIPYYNSEINQALLEIDRGEIAKNTGKLSDDFDIEYPIDTRYFRFSAENGQLVIEKKQDVAENKSSFLVLKSAISNADKIELQSDSPVKISVTNGRKADIGLNFSDQGIAELGIGGIWFMLKINTSDYEVGKKYRISKLRITK
ncbi:XcbB/CpsF family capsular polysaccharide biosynthesis protein [Pseudolactococcus insecticola]|uniref:Uncharacterized protein n=1 Tax=Pseudolactococcus insecticola TaxID=2709158 RepID=A0A6A0B9D1_9LACT|nr:XcbB/CpsF family capsular polysaccharide biosynthesis protein [Lactococcus insecticola]GFH40934.1 hypothetical protein Hs20B_13320 [Lactococcus insecticola]